MDKLAYYKTVTKEMLEEYLARHEASRHDTDVQTLLITDDEHGHYMILKCGWHGKDRVQHILIYIRLVGGKIWVEEDWTDYEVVERLLESGIPQEDVVLAFHHPLLRPHAEFAAS